MGESPVMAGTVVEASAWGIAFWGLAVVSVTAAVCAVTRRTSSSAARWFALMTISNCALMLLHNAIVLAAAMFFVQMVGVLQVCAMFSGGQDSSEPQVNERWAPRGAVVSGGVLLGVLLSVFYTSGLPRFVDVGAFKTIGIEELGRTMFSEHGIAMVVLGLLFLAGAVSSVVLLREKRNFVEIPEG